MTEKHIKQLYALLSQSSPEGSSKELDDKILLASKERLSQIQSTDQFGQSSSWLKRSLAPLGFIRTAGIAVSLTLVIFLGMGQLLSFDHDDLIAIKPNLKEQDGMRVIGTKPFISETKLASISKPVQELIEQAPMQVQRDKALLESVQSIGLPDTDDLLATIEFVVESDRALAQVSIDNAMGDIHSMLIQGELNNARERYVQLKQVQLKQHCPPCRLPNSLDDLLIAQTSAEFNTG